MIILKEYIGGFLQISELLAKKKTEHMIIGSRQRLNNIQEEPVIKIANESIKKLSKCKTLGVVIDDQLLWRDPFNETNTKVSKGLGMIKRFKPFVTESVLATKDKSLILQYFDHCSMVWGNATDNVLEKLQKIQNKVSRILTGSSYQIPSSDLLRKLNWKTLKERRDNKKAILTCKVKHGLASEAMDKLFQIANKQNYSLRSNLNNFVADKPNTNLMKKSISYAGVQCWNNLSSNLKGDTVNLKTFRAILEK